jgi:hypothetical protein
MLTTLEVTKLLFTVKLKYKAWSASQSQKWLKSLHIFINIMIYWINNYVHPYGLQSQGYHMYDSHVLSSGKTTHANKDGDGNTYDC